MSGIVGTYFLDGRPAERVELGRMVETMAHRGPDGRSLWCEGPVGMGHLMLHTTPESLNERLPLESLRTRAVITSDARIDNRSELMAQLELAGRTASVVSDSELILASYEKWGEDCPEKLLGAFAFAIWDPARRRLFCAKDHLGVKNLYFWHRPGRGFACATEIKALLAHPDIPEQIDEEQLGAYLAVLLDAKRTVFKGIHRLLPGHTLTVSPDGLTSRRYWEPAPSREAIPSDDRACTERFMELFQDAVECRLRSAHPVGSELSGGLDSSYVTCVARDLLGADDAGPLSAISLVYDKFPESDERDYIEDVVAQGGVQPHYVPVEERGLLDILDEIFDYLDDGRTAGNHHLNWLTASAARDAGVRVLLTGQDGDTTVYHGWQYFKELARAGRWEEFAREARQSVDNIRREHGSYAMQETFTNPRDFLNAYAGTYLKEWAVEGNYIRFARAINGISKHFGVSRSEMYRRFWRDLVLPSSIARSRYEQVQADSARSAIPEIIDPDLADHIGLDARLAEDRLEKAFDVTVRESQRRVFNSPHLLYSFEKFEHYGAACGVEMRHPFMDKRLVEYCLALPPEQSMKHGWTRVIMRRAMDGVVPDSIRWRVGKTSLAAPYGYLLRQKSREQLRDVISGIEVAGDVIDTSYVKKIYERGEEASSDETHDLGTAVSLALWLQKRGKHSRAAVPEVVG